MIGDNGVTVLKDQTIKWVSYVGDLIGEEGGL
jgi:hypothetical protein